MEGALTFAAVFAVLYAARSAVAVPEKPRPHAGKTVVYRDGDQQPATDKGETMLRAAYKSAGKSTPAKMMGVRDRALVRDKVRPDKMRRVHPKAVLGANRRGPIIRRGLRSDDHEARDERAEHMSSGNTLA